MRYQLEILQSEVRKMLNENKSSADDQSNTLWRAASDQGLLQICSESEEAFYDLLLVMMELGRVASNLPVLESAIVNLFAPGFVPDGARVALYLPQGGEYGIPDQITYENDTLTGVLRQVEGAANAEYFIGLLPNNTLVSFPATNVGIEISPTPALAPDLADLCLSNVKVSSLSISPSLQDRLIKIYKLGVCARAYGAAKEGFELSVDYANVRKQFGKVIGSYQAIQHKLANSLMQLEGCRLQFSSAARALDRSLDSDVSLSLATSAIAFACQSLRKVALETQHNFGAIGFAEEHCAPSLFRRVHGDIARCVGGDNAESELGSYILDAQPGKLAGLCAPQDDSAGPLRARFREWLSTNWSREDRDNHNSVSIENRYWNLEFARKLGSGGWTTLSWPEAGGGLAATPYEQLAFSEELLKAGATDYPLLCSCRVMAPEIIAHGSAELREATLPGLRAGTMTGCLGYSEPESGSDLASLRTKAVRDGDDYIINGQKIWTTDGHRATHMLLAARTSPDPKLKHAGISLFVLPMNTSGITVHEMPAMYGQKFCSIFFDDVRLPAMWRLGDENAGWKILANALANERIAIAAFVLELQLLIEKLVLHIQKNTKMVQAPLIRNRMGLLISELITGRCLALDSITKMGEGNVPLVEAAMAKVYVSELAQRISEAAIDMLGGPALLSEQADNAPADGMAEQILRSSIMYVVGGGSNEIQRSIIAQRGLKLSR